MNKKYVFWMAAGLILTGAGILAAVLTGTKDISLETVYRSIFDFQEQLDMQLVRDSRLPRAVCSALAGGMLAMSGAVMQGVTGNPVADPSVLGMTQGATLAVSFVTVYGAFAGTAGRILGSFGGALVSGLMILLFGIPKQAGVNISRMLLAGTALGTFFLSLASTIALLGNRSQELAFWAAGGFGNTGWTDVLLLLAAGSICTIFCFLLAGKINILSLGEETAAGLGLNPAKTRFCAIALLVPVIGGCVAVSGNIVFVGLIVPHVVRRLAGFDYRRIIPLSFVWGSVLLVWADIAAKMANLPYETPIGLFTAILGVPVFLALVRKERS